jgi:GT2 family glycosyltransferase
MQENYLSIIIVNFNTKKHLLNCIESLDIYNSNLKHEIIVVDNFSDDRQYLPGLLGVFPNVKLILNDKNTGFGAACNIGARISSGEYLLFLNPDIIIKSNILDLMVDALINSADTAVCGGVLMDDDGNQNNSFNHFPGVAWEFREAFGLFIGKAHENLYYKNAHNSKDCFEIDWVSGADILIKKKIFEEVKGFDEKIFLYYEDVDLQKRIRDKGYKVICNPEAIMFHHGKSSINSDKVEYTYYYYMHKNKLYYYGKHNNIIYTACIRFIWISGTIFKISILFFRKPSIERKKIKLKQYLIILLIHLGIKK